MLAIRLRGDPYALRLAGIAGLFADKPLTRLPGSAREFLGLAGFRGTVVPVYDLRALLGHGRTEAPRWLVVAAGAIVALAFDGFDGYLKLPPERIAPSAAGDACFHVHELARPADGALRPLVNLGSVLMAIRQRVHQDPSPASTGVTP
ncbi:MAG: chemotaxis protein CheW [Betaproteobacteria bacterium]|nr:MAG: chemotaxis protein CheW [Betaproteobacteria bacterium]